MYIQPAVVRVMPVIDEPTRVETMLVRLGAIRLRWTLQLGRLAVRFELAVAMK